MESDDQRGSEKSLARQDRSHDIIPLGDKGSLDLSSLPEEDRNELKKAFVQGQLALHEKMQELGIENEALDRRIGDMSRMVEEASSASASATITGAYNDKMGRTEVILGNTETAAKGKLDRTQKGQRDMTLVYVVIAAVAAVIITAILFGR